jgi:hypothetical protein
MPRTSGGSILPSRPGSAWIAKQRTHSLTMSIVSNDTLAAEQNQTEDRWNDYAMETWKLVARFARNFMRVSPRLRLN